MLGILGRDGAMSERFLMPERTLVPLPTAIPDEQAVFAEPLAAALHVTHVLRPDTGPTVVLGDGKLGQLIAGGVIGTGPVGLVRPEDALLAEIRQPQEPVPCPLGGPTPQAQLGGYSADAEAVAVAVASGATTAEAAGTKMGSVAVLYEDGETVQIRAPLGPNPTDEERRAFADAILPAGVGVIPSFGLPGAAIGLRGYLDQLRRHINGLGAIVQSAFIGGRYSHYAGNLGVVTSNRGADGQDIGTSANTIGVHWVDPAPLLESEVLPSGLDAVQAITSRGSEVINEGSAMVAIRRTRGSVLSTAPIIPTRRYADEGAVDTGAWIADDETNEYEIAFGGQGRFTSTFVREVANGVPLGGLGTIPFDRAQRVDELPVQRQLGVQFGLTTKIGQAAGGMALYRQPNGVVVLSMVDSEEGNTRSIMKTNVLDPEAIVMDPVAVQPDELETFLNPGLWTDSADNRLHYWTGGIWNTDETVAFLSDLVGGGLSGTFQGEIWYWDGFAVQTLGLGTAGQVLTVNALEDAPEWADPTGGGFSPPGGAKGDLLVGDDGPDYDVLAAGADNEIPTYDSTAPLGLIPRSIADILTAEGIDFTGSSGGRRVVTIETYAFPGTASWTYTPTQSLGVGQGFIIFAMGQGSGTTQISYDGVVLTDNTGTNPFSMQALVQRKTSTTCVVGGWFASDGGATLEVTTETVSMSGDVVVSTGTTVDSVLILRTGDTAAPTGGGGTNYGTVVPGVLTMPTCSAVGYSATQAISERVSGTTLTADENIVASTAAATGAVINKPGFNAKVWHTDGYEYAVCRTATTTAGLYRRANGSTSWALQGSTWTVNNLVLGGIYSVSGKVVVLYTNSTIQAGVWNGSTLTHYSSGAGSTTHAIQQAVRHGTGLWLIADNGAGNNICLTFDTQTLAWSNPSIPLGSLAIWGILSHYGEILVTGTTGVYRHTGGTRWVLVAAHAATGLTTTANFCGLASVDRDTIVYGFNLNASAVARLYKMVLSTGTTTLLSSPAGWASARFSMFFVTDDVSDPAAPTINCYHTNSAAGAYGYFQVVLSGSVSNSSSSFAMGAVSLPEGRLSEGRVEPRTNDAVAAAVSLAPCSPPVAGQMLLSVTLDVDGSDTWEVELWVPGADGTRARATLTGTATGGTRSGNKVTGVAEGVAMTVAWDCAADGFADATTLYPSPIVRLYREP